MKTMQPNLINFSVFKVLGLFDGHVSIAGSGIIHVKKITCPICGTLCVYNGCSNKGKHVFSRSTGSVLRKGQQYCPSCDKTVQAENVWSDDLVKLFNDFIVSQVLSCSSTMSEDEIVKHLNNTISVKVCKSTVHAIVNKSNEDFESVEFDYEIRAGIYGYDEQYLKIDGKRAYRIVFYNIKENKIIYEKIHYKFSKKVLKETLIEVFGDPEFADVKPAGFVVDMRVEYPNAFKDVFGRKIKVQFCIFHLNKLILKEYKDSLKLGKTVRWTLMHYYNMYSLFNIFYNRTFELKTLKGLMKQFENFKDSLTSEKVKFYVDKYNLKLKTFEKQKQKVIEIIQKKLMKSFRRILHDKKNLRKRQGKTLEARTIQSAKRIFAKVYDEKTIHPMSIQERIEKIKKNFEYFIATGGEVLTNNKLEGFFGATLKKFRKKNRKSLLSFSALLKRKRAQQEGIPYFRKFTLFELAKIFTALTFFT